MTYGILVDVTRCQGCERCVAACVGASRPEGERIDPTRAELDRATTKDGLSAHRLTTVVKVAEGRFARKSCMHCLEPSCVSACLVGALSKTPEGPVVYARDKCIGCRYCMLACPFHIPRYEWDQTTPYVKKCDMCITAVRAGGKPACVAGCPHEALAFGPRNELIEMAHRRINTEPGRYLDHVWGEKELGGTSVLYISDEDLADMDWPTEPTGPIPHLTEPLIASTPFIGAGVAVGLLGINWIIRRRMRLAALGAAEPAEDPNPEVTRDDE